MKIEVKMLPVFEVFLGHHAEKMRAAAPKRHDPHRGEAVYTTDYYFAVTSNDPSGLTWTTASRYLAWYPLSCNVFRAMPAMIPVLQ